MKIKANPIKLSQEQIQFYDDNGYLIVPNVFEPEACEEIIQAAAKVAAEDFSVYLNIHRDMPLFMEIAKDPVLVAIVKAVQRHKITLTNDQFLYKKPGTTYGKQAWQPHQDNAFLKAPQEAYMQLHIFLEKSEKENGGLYCYPGSHKEPILPYEYVHSWREKPDADGVTRPGWKVVPPAKYKCIDLTAPRGAICLQHGHLIHGSHPNMTKDRSRQQYSLAYLNEGAPFEKGTTSPKIPVSVE